MFILLSVYGIQFYMRISLILNTLSHSVPLSTETVLVLPNQNHPLSPPSRPLLFSALLLLYVQVLSKYKRIDVCIFKCATVMKKFANLNI